MKGSTNMTLLEKGGGVRQIFVERVKAYPQDMNEKPVETEFRFLIETWPCPEITCRDTLFRVLVLLLKF